MENTGLSLVPSIGAEKRPAEDDGEGIQTLDISKLKFVVKAEWAIECALLDLLGQHLGVPVCELLAEGKQRDRVEVLGYLFYVSDKGKTDLPYLDESASSDPWFRMRRREMLTHEQIVEQACCLKEKYGYRNFKLKGGYSKGAYEMDTIRALKKQFPEGTDQPGSQRSLEPGRGHSLCRGMHGILTYIEDPCGPEGGIFQPGRSWRSSRTPPTLPVATNMIATNWRQFYHAAALKSVDIVLADPHFWGLEGSLRMASLLNDWGTHMGKPFQQPFRYHPDHLRARGGSGAGPSDGPGHPLDLAGRAEPFEGRAADQGWIPGGSG